MACTQCLTFDVGCLVFVVLMLSVCCLMMCETWATNIMSSLIDIYCDAYYVIEPVNKVGLSVIIVLVIVIVSVSVNVSDDFFVGRLDTVNFYAVLFRAL